jgi:hypothetical protein
MAASDGALFSDPRVGTPPPPPAAAVEVVVAGAVGDAVTPPAGEMTLEPATGVDAVEVLLLLTAGVDGAPPPAATAAPTVGAVAEPVEEGAAVEAVTDEEVVVVSR